MVRPPLLYRALINPFRQWLEDRAVPDAGYLDQMRALWRQAGRQRVVWLRDVTTRRRKVA